MANVEPIKLTNGDNITVDGKDYTVLYVKPETNDRVRIYNYAGGSISVPSNKKIKKT